MTEPKRFECNLVLNYKTGKFKVYSNKQKGKKIKLTLSDIPMHVQLDVSIPIIPKFEIKGNIELTPIEMSNIVMDKIIEGEQNG